MKEKIILAPNANSTELLRTLAKYNANEFLVRIFNANEFAKYALMKAGVINTEKFITNKQQAYIIGDFIKDSAYFKTKSLQDAINVANSINELRMLIIKDEKETINSTLKDHGEFREKNNALVEIYNKYIDHLSKNHLYDSICLIRKAIKEAKTFDAEFISFTEFPLTPLEKELIKTISGNTAIIKSILDEFNVAKKDINIDKYSAAYGKVNEIEDIISYIYRNSIPLDKCNIVISNNSYLQEISDLSSNYNISVTYGTGLPITISNPMKIVDLIDVWNNEGKNGIDAFRDLVSNNAFDSNKLFGQASTKEKDYLIKATGSLRFSFDENINNNRLNKSMPVLEKDERNSKYASKLTYIKDELNKGLIYLLKEYTIIRNDFDATALVTITSAIEEYDHFRGLNYSELFEDLRKKNIGKEISKEGYLHITSFNNALSSIRDNMFIVGMSSSNFPGSPKENYLLLDSDLEMFSLDAKTSSRKINDKKENLTNLLTVCKSLDTNVRMSYSSFIIADLKEDNPSSFMFDLYVKQFTNNDYDKFINSLKPVVGYFDHGINNYEEIGKAFNKNEKIVVEETILSSSSISQTETFTPTQIELFFSCPKRFYLRHIVGVEEKEEDDPYVILDPSATGIMYHKLMEERMNNRTINKVDFMKAADEKFEEYIKTRPPVDTAAKQIAKDEFIDLCEKGYDSDPNNKVLLAEKWIESELEGIKIGGFPDRIEEDGDGRQLIADFKTKKRIEHSEDDLLSCLQVLLYAYTAINNKAAGGKKYNIEKCTYRYPRFEHSVDINYDAETESFIRGRMKELKEAIDKNDFPIAEKEKQNEACKYCKLSKICGKDQRD